MYVDSVDVKEGQDPDGMPVRAARAATSRDPAVGLKAVAALRRLVEQLEALQVDNARDHGWSWQQIAEVLDVSRQAVHKKYARLLKRR